MRRDLTFPSGGDTCAAWLFEPTTDGDQPWPCVVLAHGFGGTREVRLDAYAERFAAAGIAALVFDYRHWGASGGLPRQLLDIGRQLDDWRAAIAFARGLTEVDADRVAAWGTSFSGGHVLCIAAEDLRLAAAISQVPFVDGLWALRAAGPAAALRLTGAALRDQLLPGEHAIPIVGAPGTTAAITTPDAGPGYLALVPEGAHFHNAVLARIGLRIATYRPARRAARVRCPWLVVVAERDAITPPQPAVAAAARAPRAELRRHDCAHFDAYVGEVWERNVADQVEFLQRTLAQSGKVAATR
jgi:fermentation-respiration switch protein FrsA (DUF1100 family)